MGQSINASRYVHLAPLVYQIQIHKYAHLHAQQDGSEIIQQKHV
jgi:hypothetical protein